MTKRHQQKRHAQRLRRWMRRFNRYNQIDEQESAWRMEVLNQEQCDLLYQIWKDPDLCEELEDRAKEKQG